MNGDADLPQRSSSPLKRRASSMDPADDGSHASDVRASGPPTDVRAGGVQRAVSVEMPDVDDAGAAAQQPDEAIPPLAEQIKIIETLVKAANEKLPQEGDQAYVVSRTWLNQALELGPGSKISDTPDGQPALGPVDNSDIVEEQFVDASGQSCVRLKPGSGLDEFELFPADAWNLVVSWYGVKDGQEAVVRTAINAASDASAVPEIMYELHPVLFTVHRLWSEISPVPIDQELKQKRPGPLRLFRSKKYHAQTLVKEMKTLAGIPLDRKVCLHTIPTSQPLPARPATGGALTPPDSPDGSEADAAWSTLLIDMPLFEASRDVRQRSILQDKTTDPKFNGKSTLLMYDLVVDQTIILDEAVNSSNSQFVSTCTARSLAQDRALPARSAAPSSITTKNGRSSASPQPAPRARVLRQTNKRSLGAVGLQNLGNTCYMNSALQCVRSVEELTKYFLTDSYNGEVNRSNPLGYNGKVAMAYKGLLKDIYAEGRGSVSPRDFKNTVGRCRSTFAGWGQQDSQEFLGFLLDALQEDLSRIVKKPYIEKPDSTDEMINDPEAIRQMAEQVWDITRKRDDSVIADLFTGMYKSTLKCPDCGKVSITFDPFNNLTLPLPIQNMWQHTVKFFPLNDAPVNIQVELPKNSAMEALKHFISERTGVPAERLIGAEEYSGCFFKIYDDSLELAPEIHSNDCPTFHELEAAPSNGPGKHTRYRSMLDIDSDSADPRVESMVVTVIHRAAGRKKSAPPHFIVLSRQESYSLEAIRRKVLEKIGTLTTWTKLKSSPMPVENADSDAVVTTASDADSSGDGKVAARSVEGEDDLVDVTMKVPAPAGSQKPAGQPSPRVLKNFNHQRPAYVDSETPLDPELDNLFTLCYFSDNQAGKLATGWQSVKSDSALQKIADRLPESLTDDGEGPDPESGSSEASDQDAGKNDEAAATRMNSESEEEDGIPFHAEPAPPRNFGGKQRRAFAHGKKLGKKTYGKAGKRQDKAGRKFREAQKAPKIRAQPTPPATADGGPLIRLGEGLVVDWAEDAWELVFGSSDSNENDFQGSPTFDKLETLHDPVLDFTKRRRKSRQSRGITLEECLDEFERAEILSEQDMWYCPRCKEHRRASKKFDLWKTPDILVAHLKRFSSSGYRRDKLDALVDFPTQGLDLTSRVLQKEDGQEEIYDLIAVDDHYGGLGGGHYTAYARNFADGEWYNYNDSSVSKVSDPSSVVTAAAYLLFYRRRSSQPLGGPRFREIFAKFESESGGEDSAEDGEAAAAAAPVRPRAARTVTTTVSMLDGSDGSDDDDDDELPAYDESRGGGGMLHDSIEPFGGSQTWSFDNINSDEAGGLVGSGFASDDAQAGASTDGADGATACSDNDDDDTEMVDPGAEASTVAAGVARDGKASEEEVEGKTADAGK